MCINTGYKYFFHPVFMHFLMTLLTSTLGLCCQFPARAEVVGAEQGPIEGHNGLVQGNSELWTTDRRMPSTALIDAKSQPALEQVKLNYSYRVIVHNLMHFRHKLPGLQAMVRAFAVGGLGHRDGQHDHSHTAHSLSCPEKGTKNHRRSDFSCDYPASASLFLLMKLQLVISCLRHSFSS